MPGYAYLKDVLTRLPTQRASEIGYLNITEISVGVAAAIDVHT